MAIRDIEAYIRERAAQFDPNLDLTSGSPFDVQVIQPLIRRIGTDPFTVDLPTFLDARAREAFPDLAMSEGDAITDLFTKPATVLWDPVVREVARVRRGMSFRDPATQTVEEAEALGANLFAERNVGEFARGVARVFFGQPQNISISPVNFITSRGGLRFFPTQVQTIRTDEMVLNLADDGTYYFDVDVIGENAGDEYNIGINQLVSIANVEAAVRVTNLRRFQRGEPAETAEEFIDRAQGELTEKSLVTLRGIAAKLTKSFPEIRRLNVVGFNDPEMQRDIINGGGVGAILESGIAGFTAGDGENQAASRRFSTAEVDFTVLIGSASLAPVGYVLTVVEGVDGATETAQDFEITRVIDQNTVEIADQVLGLGRTDRRWMLRRRELTLSGIPGGIVFPDSPNGTVTINQDEVHVGGMVDVHVRGTGFDEETLVLDNVTDDVVELSGTQATPKLLTGLSVVGFELPGFVPGTDYDINSSTYRLIEDAGRNSLSLQIVTGGDSSNHGVYRIVRSYQSSGSPVELQVSPDPPVPDGLAVYRWRLFDEINIDLVDPKETRVSGDDLVTVQNSDQVTTGGALNFDDLGVSEGDTLRILDGLDAGDYTIISAPLPPGDTVLQIDTELLNTGSNLSYTVFRANSAGGIDLPLIRVKTVELLDTANQPLGTVIPYAKPVDIQSRAFQNPARGVKHTLSDAQLGIISQTATGGNFPGISAAALAIRVLFPDGSTTVVNPAIATDSIADVLSGLNAALQPHTGSAYTAFQFDANRIAIRPGAVGIAFEGDAPGLTALFGSAEPYTTADIRSASVSDWDALSPAVDYATGLDVVQIIGGNQVGFYPAPYSGPATTRLYDGAGGAVGDSGALIIRNTDVAPDENTRQFAPEEGVRLQLGARSLGSVRCYFLEPTTVEFDENSYFYVETDAGLLRFVPDPTLNHQIVPPLPSDDKSNDGSTDTGSPNELTAASQDFLRSGVEPGDQLVVDYIPLAGTVVLADPVVELAAKPSIFQAAKTLVFSLDSGPDLTVTFVTDDASLNEGEVSRQGVVDQINSRAGRTIAQLTSGNELEFEADALIRIRSTSTASMPSGPFLGLLDEVAGTGSAEDFSTDQDNESPQAGTYDITDVGTTTLDVLTAFGPITPYTGTTLSRQGFRIYRTGVQRISTTQMAQNEAEADLYYFDVELVSEGTGDVYNISADIQLFVDVFRSDGYYLTTDDENLAFPIGELPKLVLSRSILEQGVDDDPTNATAIAGQNIQVTYERSQLVEDVQNYITAETERVAVSNMLARHLIPNYVRFDLNYTGGSREEVVVPLVETFIRDLLPVDAMESSDLQKIVLDQGATSIENPLDLISIEHRVDRSIQATRSQNSLDTGRLSAFIPDVLNITRDVT